MPVCSSKHACDLWSPYLPFFYLWPCGVYPSPTWWRHRCSEVAPLVLLLGAMWLVIWSLRCMESTLSEQQLVRTKGGKRSRSWNKNYSTNGHENRLNHYRLKKWTFQTQSKVTILIIEIRRRVSERSRQRKTKMGRRPIQWMGTLVRWGIHFWWSKGGASWASQSTSESDKEHQLFRGGGGYKRTQ